ncbi:hypothetical protein BH09BAC2_BH09BAC2_08530 [soil metagenome]
MKKIFPIITVLILLSLLGIIFFQYLWISQALSAKEQQFQDRVNLVTSTAANDLMLDRSSLSPFDRKKNNDAFYPLNVFPPTVSNRYTRDEIRSKISKAFEKHELKKVPFEFAITTTSRMGSDVESENFYKLFTDTNNVRHIYPLDASNGYDASAPEELLVLIVPHVKSIVWNQMAAMILVSSLFTIIIVSAFFITIRALLNQKKLSEIKSDFINNMTHEFKTPLATISLAVDALKNDKVINDPEKREYFSGIIKEENKRMNKQVETILQAALLDKREIQLNLRPLHAHEQIEAALNNMRLPIQEKQGKLEVNLNASNDLVIADEVHFTNLINNLLDNAVKYSKDEELIVKISTANEDHRLKIKIEDNGIGMNKETLHHIFEKFYRAHTGNIHNVKGFGLGLNYVKTIVRAHKGTIKAESTPGKGSCFTISMPQVN